MDLNEVKNKIKSWTLVQQLMIAFGPAAIAAIAAGYENERGGYSTWEGDYIPYEWGSAEAIAFGIGTFAVLMSLFGFIGHKK